MILELNDENYSDFMQSTNKNVFIDFYSPSCGPCHELLGLLEELDIYAQDKGVTICKCNVNQNPKIASKYMIRSVPVTVVVNSEKEIKDANVGLGSRAYYFELIDNYSSEKKSFFKKLFS